MLPSLYDLIYISSAFILLPWLGYRYAFRRKYRESLAGMIGWRMPRALETRSEVPKPLIFWVHSVSVGEVVAARGVIREIRNEYPNAIIYASTITETGQAQAHKILSDLVNEIFYYPVDFSWIVRRFLRRIQPDVYIMMETELWPNFLMQCRKAGVRVLMMNGKISERSYRLYGRFLWLFRRALRGIDAFCMQTRLDGARMKALCGKGPQVFVTGNCKFDSVPQKLDLEERVALAGRWGLDLLHPVIVVGSTHPGEEEFIAGAAADLKDEFLAMTWVVAPRHVERSDAVCKLFQDNGLTVSRATGPSGKHPNILLLDKMGELAQAYSLATVSVVGGSFVPIGGHNLLEPAVYGVPVLFGPHMHKQPEILRFFNESGGGVQIRGEELGPMIRRLLHDPKECKRLGRLAMETIELNRGSAQRHMHVLREVLASDKIRKP